MKVIAVFALVALVGCTSARPMYSAPGVQRFEVECPPLQPGLCEERAAKECGGAFDVVLTRPGRGTQQRSLVVDCR